MNRFTVLLTACGALCACSFAPPYHVPDTAAAPLQYEGMDWQPARPLDGQSKGSWWTSFGDPGLDALEIRLGHDNQSLKAAAARLEQARDEWRIVRADLFPALDGKASAVRERASPNGPRFPVTARPLADDFSTGVDLSYEVDFWGRIRNQVASAKADQQASAADLAFVELSARAELAMDYFSLRSEDTQRQILEQTVEDNRASLQLRRNLFAGGAAPLVDVAQAEAQFETAQSQAADIGLQRSQTEHAIAVLLGENPAAFHLAANPLGLDVVPPPIDPGLPSSLLQRRPDIAEAERHVAAANAQIGVARAAYFPQFTLSGGAGFESTSTANLVSVPSRFWSFGPQVTLPLFEGGRLVAQTDRTRAAYAEQVANYRNTVLTAYRDVEDELAALRQLEIERRTDAAAVTATQTVLEQARHRYDAGIATYLEVASAETAALQARLAAANLQARRLAAGVLLVKALGGGWQPDA